MFRFRAQIKEEGIIQDNEDFKYVGEYSIELFDRPECLRKYLTTPYACGKFVNLWTNNHHNDSKWKLVPIPME